MSQNSTAPAGSKASAAIVAGSKNHSQTTSVRPAPLEQHVGALAERLAGHRLGTLRRAAGVRYDVAANWKAIVQNYSECLHCPGVHPELNRLTHYLSGVDHEGPGDWCGGAMALNEGVATMGRGGGWPPIAGVSEREVSTTRCCPTR